MRRDEDPFERSKPIHRLFNAGFPSATLRATYSCWHRSDHVRGTDASSIEAGGELGGGAWVEEEAGGKVVVYAGSVERSVSQVR
mmetsp:Transcript_74316/g.147666  ORF Transcript_74316/g.147666 Transcript_74316/m.147666 type:complete len:84 (-) Transcript_74316:583-834(-)